MTPRDTLIEAIAKAIYEEHWRTRGSRDSRCLWEKHAELGKRSWLLEAAVALEAIEAMGCVVVPRESRIQAQAFLDWNRSIKPDPLVQIGYEIGVFQRAIYLAASPYAKEKT